MHIRKSRAKDKLSPMLREARKAGIATPAGEFGTCRVLVACDAADHPAAFLHATLDGDILKVVSVHAPDAATGEALLGEFIASNGHRVIEASDQALKACGAEPWFYFDAVTGTHRRDADRGEVLLAQGVRHLRPFEVVAAAPAPDAYFQDAGFKPEGEGFWVKTLPDGNQLTAITRWLEDEHGIIKYVIRGPGMKMVDQGQVDGIAAFKAKFGAKGGQDAWVVVQEGAPTSGPIGKYTDAPFTRVEAEAYVAQKDPKGTFGYRIEVYEPRVHGKNLKNATVRPGAADASDYDENDPGLVQLRDMKAAADLKIKDAYRKGDWREEDRWKAYRQGLIVQMGEKIKELRRFKLKEAGFKEDVLSDVPAMKPGEELTYDTCREDQAEVVEVVEALEAQGVEVKVGPPSLNLVVEKRGENYTEEEIQFVIVNAQARNLFTEDDTDADKRRLAIEFLDDIRKESSMRPAHATKLNKTAASPDDVRDLLSIPSGGKKCYKIKNLYFTIYFDSETAQGDKGEKVPGMISGYYEVTVSKDGSGDPVNAETILRQHVSPGKPGGLQQYYAAELCVDAMLKWVNSHGKDASMRPAYATAKDRLAAKARHLTAAYDFSGISPELLVDALIAAFPGKGDIGKDWIAKQAEQGTAAFKEGEELTLFGKSIPVMSSFPNLIFNTKKATPSQISLLESVEPVLNYAYAAAYLKENGRLPKGFDELDQDSFSGTLEDLIQRAVRTIREEQGQQDLFKETDPDMRARVGEEYEEHKKTLSDKAGATAPFDVEVRRKEAVELGRAKIAIGDDYLDDLAFDVFDSYVDLYTSEGKEYADDYLKEQRDAHIDIIDDGPDLAKWDAAVEAATKTFATHWMFGPGYLPQSFGNRLAAKIEALADTDSRIDHISAPAQVDERLNPPTNVHDLIQQQPTVTDFAKAPKAPAPTVAPVQEPDAIPALGQPVPKNPSERDEAEGEVRVQDQFDKDLPPAGSRPMHDASEDYNDGTSHHGSKRGRCVVSEASAPEFDPLTPDPTVSVTGAGTQAFAADRKGIRASADVPAAPFMRGAEGTAAFAAVREEGEVFVDGTVKYKLGEIEYELDYTATIHPSPGSDERNVNDEFELEDTTPSMAASVLDDHQDDIETLVLDAAYAQYWDEQKKGVVIGVRTATPSPIVIYKVKDDSAETTHMMTSDEVRQKLGLSAAQIMDLLGTGVGQIYPTRRPYTVMRVAGAEGKSFHIKVPGLKGTLGQGPGYPWDSPAAQKLVDKAMADAGYGSRLKEEGPYGGDYWEKGGQCYRIHEQSDPSRDTLQMVPMPSADKTRDLLGPAASMASVRKMAMDFSSIAPLLQSEDVLSNRELQRAVRLSLSAEQDAVHLYELIADSIGNDKTAKLFQEVADEEKVHIGEFQQLLNMMANDEKFLDEGAEEAQDTLNK